MTQRAEHKQQVIVNVQEMLNNRMRTQLEAIESAYSDVQPYPQSQRSNINNKEMGSIMQKYDLRINVKGSNEKQILKSRNIPSEYKIQAGTTGGPKKLIGYKSYMQAASLSSSGFESRT